MSGLRQTLQIVFESDRSQSHPHRRETLRLPGVRKEVRQKLQQERAREANALNAKRSRNSVNFTLLLIVIFPMISVSMYGFRSYKSVIYTILKEAGIIFISIDLLH